MTVAAFAPYESKPRWVAWKPEKRGGRMTKVPYAATGGRAAADTPKTWANRAAAEARAVTLINSLGGGSGIMLGDLGDGTALGGIDLDTCRAPDGAFEPWAAEIIEKLASYSEVSPSLTGAKIFFRYKSADLPLLLAEMGAAKHGKMFKRANGGADHPPAIEIHLSARYFAVTEQWLDSTPDEIITVATDTLLWILKEAGPAFAGAGKRKSSKSRSSTRPTKTRQTKAESASTDQSRSGKAFAVACRAQRENWTFDAMVVALRGNDETAKWVVEKGEPNNGRELIRLWEAAGATVAVTLNDFRAYMPMHSYIYIPTRTLWPSNSVNARIPPVAISDIEEVKASVWLDQNLAVEQMTWAPGRPEIIKNQLLVEGGWVNHPGARCFNLYLPPAIIPGDARRADPWLDHVRLVYPNEAEHFIDWLAHRVQRPEQKINHALVLGGEQGIGKDTILEPVKQAIGPWNFEEVSPLQVLGRFNGFLKSVILRISEARDLGEFDRFKFYDHMKAYTASPPDMLRVDEKHMREYSILNVCGIIITTNYKTDGIYLSADDRRHYVGWSDHTKEDECFAGDYWNRLYAYFADGGNQAVAAYLAQRDLRSFNPKAPPPKTEAFWAIANANRSPEEPEMADALDLMGRPAAFTLTMLIHTVETQPGGYDGSFVDWLRDRKNRRAIPHRLDKCGYVPVRNPYASDGQWVIGNRRQAVYAAKNLALRDQISSAQKLQQQG